MVGNAQIKYIQDFENGFGNMILLDIDGKIPAEQVSSFGNTWSIDEDDNGNHWGVSNSYFTEPAKANDWLITPVISDINENTILQWKAFSYNSLFPEQYEVRVSPTGGSNPSDFTKIIYSVSEEGNEVITRGIGLSEFKGNNIRIAFRNIAFDKYLLYIDEIKIEDVLRYDVSIQNLEYEKYPMVNTSSTFSFELLNTGAQTINSIDFQLKIGNKDIFFTKTGLNIGFLDQLTISPDSTIIHTTAEKVWIELIVLRINGETIQGNFSQFAVHFLQNKWKRKIMAENMTSTHCGWCPKGIFYKDEINASNADDIINISVHNEDILTNSEYEGGLNDIYEFNNFPEVVINRKSTIDPSNLLSTINTFNNKNFAPAKLTTLASKSERKVWVETQVTFNTSFIDDDLRIIVSLIEDSIVGNGFAYDQANIYAGGGLGMLGGFENLPDPIPYNDIVYNQVARELPFGFKGRDDLLGINYVLNDSPSFGFEVDIDSNYILENASIVVMIADGDGEILNAEKINFNIVSTTDIEKNDGLRIFPNPTTGWVEIKSDLETLEKNTIISIYNANGQLYKEFKSYNHMVDLSDYPAGLYLFKIRSVTDTYICKVFKN